MDEAALDRMAIEEIVREMNEARALELQRPMERKINPLGRPNKQFLGRTINSVLTYNKRENDRKRENCRRKLEDLDERARRRQNNGFFNEERRKHISRSKSRSLSSVSISSSSCCKSSEKKISRRIKKKSKKKKKAKKSRHRRNSTSSDSSVEHKSKYKEHKKETDQQNRAYTEEADYYAGDNYEQARMHYSTIAAAYNQIQHMCQYSLMLASSASLARNLAASETVENASPERIKRSKSDSSLLSATLSLSFSSSCSLEEDENGVLTINVSSDNEQVNKFVENRRVENTNDSDVALMVSSSSECSHGEVCINLDSDSKHGSKATNGSLSILCCSSDSEKECGDTASLIVEQPNDESKSMIDLTED